MWNDITLTMLNRQAVKAAVRIQSFNHLIDGNLCTCKKQIIEIVVK